MLKKEIESLEQQIFILEEKVGRGDFNPKTTKVEFSLFLFLILHYFFLIYLFSLFPPPLPLKVLHMSINPDSIAQEEKMKTLQSLKKENEQLIAKIEELSKMKSNTENSAQFLNETSYSTLKYQTLEKKLQESELRMQRLKEV